MEQTCLRLAVQARILIKKGTLFMTAEILSVGTELLLGDIVNTDAAFIAKKLAFLGIPLYHQSVVGDNAERLSDSLRLALSRADVVIMTGGLGPTCDDITKKVTAEVFGLPLEEHAESRRAIEGFFQDIGREMTENNLSQAMLPKGAVALANHHGTAPGVLLTGKIDGIEGERTVIMLPGPPKELEPMFNESVLPYLRERSPYTIWSLNLHLYGIGESAAEMILRPLMEESENPSIAPYAAEGEVRLRITARAESREECEALCRAMADRVRNGEIGKYIRAESSSDDESSEVTVRRMIELLREKGLTIGFAESCTAGMISARVADIAGCSDVLLGGIVSYANEVKMNVLGVSAEVLKTRGAVSEECAAQMAEGARRVLGCDIAVSVTGIAGPGGGTAEKPVGTVCFGLSDKYGTITETKHFGAFSDRGRVRRLTVTNAILKVIDRLSQNKL